jgi:hypothetical protein
MLTVHVLLRLNLLLLLLLLLLLQGTLSHMSPEVSGSFVSQLALTFFACRQHTLDRNSLDFGCVCFCCSSRLAIAIQCTQ